VIIGEWIRRLNFLLRRSAMEEELRRELESHRAEMGEPKAFGNTLRLREESRDAWGWKWLDDLVQDSRFAWRTLRRTPGFTITAIATLALGIGVNVGMFSLVNGLLFRPLYPGADQVVLVRQQKLTPPTGGKEISYANFQDLQKATAGLFTSLAVSSDDFLGLDAGNGARSAYASTVSAGYFDVFGRPLAFGRVFSADEERPGAGVRVAIISYALWEQLGQDRAVLNQVVRVDGEQFTVVGVAPEGFSGMSIPGPEVFLPLGARETKDLNVVGRLRAGLIETTAEPSVRAIPAPNAGYTYILSAPSMRLMFMPGSGTGDFAAVAVLLMLMPLVVLLVACLNLADLLFARGHLRRQELAVRSSLGGGRWRLVRQLLTEGLLLATAGGTIGLVLSLWTTKAMLASMRPLIPVAVTLPDVSLDWRIFAGTVAFCLFATVVFAAGPALALTRRAAAVDLKQQSGDEARKPRGLRLGRVLIAGQVALSLLLLACGGLFLMSVVRSATVDPGFKLEGGLVVEIDPALAGYKEPRGRQAQLGLLERLRAVPGVEIATIASGFPFSGFNDSREVTPAGIDGAQAQPVGAVFTITGRDYARVLGLPLLAGRDFSESEVTSSSGERVAIVDDALAAQLWPSANAVGRQIQFLDGEEAGRKQPLTIVGIIPAVKHSLGNPRPSPHVYVPLGQHYSSAMTMQLRVAGGQSEQAMLATVARVAREFDDRLPVISATTWRGHMAADLEVVIHRAGAAVFSAFGAIAVLLAVLGVYGVKAYIVSRRTREFGIRIALGAQPRALLWQVLREGGRLTAVGVALGLLLAIGAGQFLQSILYGVNGIEPLVLAAATLILLAASLLASYLPALRATKVNPTIALRSE
jgi:predicted permease